MMANSAFSDQDMLTDDLSSQKFITDVYNTYANECANVALKNQLMNILTEEHDIQFDIYSEMAKRGWYQTEAADQNKINQAKQKFSAQNN